MASRGTVYVVDDDASLRTSFSRMISLEGYDVSAFSSAKDFLAAGPARSNGDPACLVLDMRMPGLNGLEVQEALSQSGKRLPIIFVTGHGTIKDCARAMRSGALDFIQKPVNCGQLLESIERGMERSREACIEEEERRAIQALLDNLTRREHEVLSLVVTGMLNKQIPHILGASEKTIKVHRARVMEKMKAGSVTDLVRMLHRLGIDTARR